jgi:hypothetical protein
LAASPDLGESSLNMATPSYVFTSAHVAEILAEDEDWLRKIATKLESEDGLSLSAQQMICPNQPSLRSW